MKRAEEIRQQIKDLEAEALDTNTSWDAVQHITYDIIPMLCDEYCQSVGEPQLVRSEVKVSIKQVNDLCSLIVETLSLKNFGGQERLQFFCYLNTEFGCFPKEVRDHVMVIVSQAAGKEL